jgi:hypothetical protein
VKTAAAEALKGIRQCSWECHPREQDVSATQGLFYRLRPTFKTEGPGEAQIIVVPRPQQ